MKKVFESISLVFIGFIFALLFIYIVDVNYERRFVLYHTLRELEIGMKKSEVVEIIQTHKTSFIREKSETDRILLSVYLGMADYLTLEINFNEGKLKTAHLYGEDSPTNVPSDAPQNIK